MTIEADNRTCEEIASSDEYRTRVAEEHRLMDERLDQGTNATNGHSNGHQAHSVNPLSLYYEGVSDLTEGERFVLKVFGDDPTMRIATDGSVLNSLER